MLLLVVALFALLGAGQTARMKRDTQQAIGYVPVAAGCQMFYWLDYAQNNSANAPTVMWLQGGPGASSLFGRFLENGPVDVYGNARNTSWNIAANMLFVDNPIGTGFSYSPNAPVGFAASDDDIANNLVLFLVKFFQQYPALAKNKFYIASESYGGKMAAKTGAALDQAIKSKMLSLNFVGVMLGDGWVGPIYCMKSYGSYLLALSLVTQAQAAVVDSYAVAAQKALDSGDYTGATNQWGNQQGYVSSICGNCNWYDITNTTDTDAQEAVLDQILSPTGSLFQQVLSQIVPNGVVYGANSGLVFDTLSGAFMRDAIASVDYLIAAGKKVNVLSGQLDLIVDVLCTEAWMSQLKWSGLPNFNAAQEQVISIGGVPQAMLQQYENFSLWKVFRAGHMIPASNPQMALLLLQKVLAQ